MKKILNEFRDFALKGNVMSLAVGIIIGSAFQGVVKSLTDNILSPLIGLVAGQNFDALQVSVFGVTISYGAFITSLINFIIMAFVVFMLVKGMNKLATMGQGEIGTDGEVLEETKTCPFCMSQIHIQATRCPACTSDLEK